MSQRHPVRARLLPLAIFTTLAVLTAPAAALAAAVQQPQGVPVATATRTAETIRIDGTLDEEAWRSAKPIGPLVQAEPDEGAAAGEQTEVRVLFTDSALYFGVVCRDRTPSAIV